MPRRALVVLFAALSLVPLAACEPDPKGPVDCQLAAAARDCWAAATGPRIAESQMQVVTGDQTISTSDQTISGVLYRGCLAIAAGVHDVTFVDVIVRTTSTCWGGNGRAAGSAVNLGNTEAGYGAPPHNIRFEYVEIDGQNASHNGLSATGYSCFRCDVHGFSINAWASNVTVTDSYFHHSNPSTNGNDPATCTHTDSIDADSGSDIVLRHNFVSTDIATCVTAAVSLNNTWENGARVIVTDNLLTVGASGASMYVSCTTALTVTGNVFAGRDPYGEANHDPANVWSANTRGDSTPVAAPTGGSRCK